jgi:hypothetical protein
MAKRYVYKNANKRPVNIGGYQFGEGQELESDVLISGFSEAVSNGFLELTGGKPETPKPDAAQAQETGSTGKVKAVWHMKSDNGAVLIREAEVYPGILLEFPGREVLGGTFEGWFKDAEFTKPVNPDKAKAPKEGELHFYGKFAAPKPEDAVLPSSDQTPNSGEGTGSAQDQDASSASSESADSGGKPAGADS